MMLRTPSNFPIMALARCVLKSMSECYVTLVCLRTAEALHPEIDNEEPGFDRGGVDDLFH
jgi:hypothetical protein